MMRKIILILISILILTFSASASVTSIDFDTCSITDWTLTGVGWSSTNTGWSSCYMKKHIAAGDAAINTYAEKSVSNGLYYSFDFSADTDTVAAASQVFDVIFKKNASGGTVGLRFSNNAGATYAVSGIGFTIVGFNVDQEKWNNYKFTISGSNIVMNVTNSSTGAQITPDQTVAYSDIVSVNFKLFVFQDANAGVSDYKIDNIYISDVPPTVGTSISWGASTYTVGDTATFTWQISDTDWNNFNRFFVRFYKNNILQDFSTFNIGCLCFSQLSVPQTGTYSVLVDEDGDYTVTLEEGILSYSILSEDTTRASAQTSPYLVIPATGYQRTNINATFNLGAGGISGVIQTFWRGADGLQAEQFEKSFYTTGTSGTQVINFSRDGTYNVKLYDYTHGLLLDTKSIIISFIPSTPSNGFTNSSINITKATYYINDVMDGNYTISATQFPLGTQYISIYNLDIGVETARFYQDSIISSTNSPIGLRDFGTFSYYIVDSPATASQQYKIDWIPGNNQIRLMNQYTNGTDATLASANFTLINLTASGYGLVVNPTTANINQPVYITTTAPTNAILSITRPNNAISYFNVSAGTTTIIKSMPSAGVYDFALSDISGNVQISAQVNVLEVTVVPTSGLGAPGTTVIGSDITSMLSSKIFWTLIFIIGIMLMVARKERDP